MASIQDYYEALAPTYDVERFGHTYGRYIDRLERECLRDWLRPYRAGRVLDLGCGTGRLLDHATTGVDASAAMLTQAAAKHPGRRLVHADLRATGLQSRAYDAALCFHVLMHLDIGAIRGVFDEAARLLRPGGRLVLDIPSAPRRRLGRRPPSGWHGDTSATLAELQDWAGPAWRLVSWRGLMFFPVHRVPLEWRPALTGIDALIGRTPLARWSSYYACALERC
ncbi:class I SAM-dependent methyltransferase [Aquabacterium sp. A7-Y]|uniref:class I SAM-dependent DNA methyltransferase n=1 Tax=Aquabacterium sp. A7-Y TaxID=1349605 RepID=UPI00223E5B74|nr:class I SAM-dependent methyltransferase [Aquabacterium sp. A7-Y]MCW7539955.1 class I SAM-dependent methyltransferase [Aquabacterium sp. A7-Y]